MNEAVANKLVPSNSIIECGCQIALALATHGSSASIQGSKVADVIGIPEHTADEILQRLVARGIVRRTDSDPSGFALARTPDVISLMSIVEAVDTTCALRECKSIPLRGDDFTKMLSKLPDEVRDQLREGTLGQLLTISRTW